MRIGIVGSEGKYWTPGQRTKVIERIFHIFNRYADCPVERRFDYKKVTLVSGGCGARGEDSRQEFDGGVDVWAEIVADVLGVEKDIKYAASMRWNDLKTGNPTYLEKTLKGFKTRNLEIARTCDALYCLEPKLSKGEPKTLWSEEYQCHYRRSGGCWTMEQAERLGKEVHLEVIK